MKKIVVKRTFILLFFVLVFVLCANAQIGYQISLLNTATGEPRANETVNVTATITDSSGGVVWTGTQSVTSNDFGVLSLTVGNAGTFTNLDLQEHRLPFFIEVSANGAMIGKSQILSVPVAEVAKRVEPGIMLEDIVGTWKAESGVVSILLTFTENGEMSYKELYQGNEYGNHSFSGDYKIDGNTIYIYPIQFDKSWMSGLGIAQIHNGYLYYEHSEGSYRFTR